MPDHIPKFKAGDRVVLTPEARVRFSVSYSRLVAAKSYVVATPFIHREDGEPVIRLREWGMFREKWFEHEAGPW